MARRQSSPSSKSMCLPRNMHMVVTPAAVVLLLLSIFYLERQFVVILNRQQILAWQSRDPLSASNLSASNVQGMVTSAQINITSCLHCRHVFYNRIPKTGSEYLLEIFKAMARFNNFTFKDNRDPYPFEPFTYPSQEEHLKFITKFFNIRSPMLYAKHLLFEDFQSFDVNQTVKYINIIRDPVERFISYYNYMRFRRDRPHKMSPKRRYMTMDECILKGDVECRDELHTFTMVSFFCGSDPICSEKDTEAVQRAKENIEKHYVAVGLLDRFREFLMILEHHLPDYFKGIVRYHDILRSRRKSRSNVTKWITKPSANATNVLRDVLKYEYDLYDFIKQRFNKQLTRVPPHLRNSKPLPIRAPNLISFMRMRGRHNVIATRKNIADIHPPHLWPKKHHQHMVISVGNKKPKAPGLTKGPNFKSSTAKLG